jgi:FAD/FMN-containing dehydrogenase
VAKLIGAILDSELTPVVLDWHNRSAPEDPFTLIVGFAGSGEEVEWQINQAASLGIAAPADLRYEEEFWRSTEPARISVLPSRLAQTLSELDPKAFVARAGNGVIFYRGDARLARPPLPLELTRRVKDTFDPKHIFPELPL